MCSPCGREGKIITGKNETQKTGDHSSCRGKITVIGIGPGDHRHLTGQARKSLLDCDVVVGYRMYVDLVRELVSGKEIFCNGMTQETKRCEKAILLASQGKMVGLISSGDAGIYGMAGLAFDLYFKKFNHHDIEIEVVPGVSSIQASAALLGAPLMHDFAVVSLSDLLTPWDLILKRLRLSTQGDFVLVLLNPKSKKRVTQIMEARQIAMKERGGLCPVGIVNNAGREKERVVVTTLESMLDHTIDMTTTVIIGNSSSYASGDKIITPRIGVKNEN